MFLVLHRSCLLNETDSWPINHTKFSILAIDLQSSLQEMASLAMRFSAICRREITSPPITLYIATRCL